MQQAAATILVQNSKLGLKKMNPGIARKIGRGRATK